MPNYWMITNRTIEANNNALGNGRSDALSYWTATQGPLNKWSSWKPCKDISVFQEKLAGVTSNFPETSDEDHADQKHVTLFVHGFNNNWADAAGRYEQICKALYSGPKSLGECVLFTWPSNGRPTDYLADRSDAQASGAALADVLAFLYDWLIDRQKAAVRLPSAACKAKMSVIAHSMGNYVLQKAAQVAWTRKNQPLLVSLINQCVMCAADVDNDLFGAGETNDKSDGDALANLSYRITALYTGLDEVLGVSAGLKHFGKRRLGRSGLDQSVPAPDNVWDVDCSGFFQRPAPKPKSIHSAYFDVPKTRDLIRQILRGTDRMVLESRGVTTA